MKRLVILMLWVAIGITRANTQQLHPGDRLPDLVFRNVLNYQVDSLRLTDFKEKLLIIDFWNTRCVACFKAFPKLDSLKKYFGDRIEILLVNNESKVFTQDFFNKRPLLYKPGVPMITDAKKLSDLFPVDGYPYTVWVQNGIVKSYSGVHAVTKETVQEFIAGRILGFRDPTLIRFASSVDYSKHDYFSSIARCSDSINIGSTEAVKVKMGKAVSIASNCYSIANLYRKAYNENGKYRFNYHYNFLLNVRELFKYEYPSNKDSLDQWLQSYAYSYELMLPVAKSEHAYRIMQEDLGRYFNLKAEVQFKLTESLVLRRRNPSDFKRQEISNMASDSIISFRQITFDQFVRELSVRIEKSYPFFVEAVPLESVSCNIRYKSLFPLNIPNLQQDIYAAGFYLAKERRIIPVLIVSDK
ncbi:thiol-disulfide isomerase/thioredoxin [Lacibacter cauensis]|uniref:Thiol-disulfide isomerase/thioredoxin n=1 Tax=Lacibacter cauensis TaxID=510947 RepID=A0A562S9S7_9BACT|nr:redoxin domain-containing protein [Lacibacter cauensis]TWI77933.1 thiol-disulfide isomerase/thioredoxin [Lacibacter cauensis]